MAWKKINKFDNDWRKKPSLLSQLVRSSFRHKKHSLELVQDFVGTNPQNAPTKEDGQSTQCREKVYVAKDAVTALVHHLRQIQLSETETTPHCAGEKCEWSRVCIKSTGLPEHATMSALLDTTDNSRDNNPNSPGNSVAGNPLGQMRFCKGFSPSRKNGRNVGTPPGKDMNFENWTVYH